MTLSTSRLAAKHVFAATDRLLPTPEGPRLLIYHQVGSGSGLELEVTTNDFVRHLDWLEDNTEVVSLEDALSRWNQPAAERLAVLTFDDGYADTYTTAYPLLRDRGLPFTLYVASQMVDSVDHPAAKGVPTMGWEEVVEMLESGLMTLGAHTHTHRDLRTVTSDEVAEELEVSDATIERRTGVRPQHFAYPWGYWSDSADGLVRERYQSATLGGSPKVRRPLDPHEVPRFPVQLSDGARFFPDRVRGGLLLEEKVRRWVRGYRGP